MEIDVKKVLEENNIKPSYQRIRIFDYLVKKKNHPTVDMIYKEVVKEIPTLSKTTVYNTLKLFTEKNIVKTVTIEEDELRFDATMEPHAHFKCLSCGSVFDIMLKDYDINKNFKDTKGAVISEIEINVRGLCKDCQK